MLLFSFARQISINASCSLEEMVEVRKPGQPLLFQIYLDKNRKNSEALVQKVEKLGFDGIFFTIGERISSLFTRGINTTSNSHLSNRLVRSWEERAGHPSQTRSGRSPCIEGCCWR